MKKLKFFFILILFPCWLFQQGNIYAPLGGGGNNAGMINSMAVDTSENMLYISGGFTQLGGQPIKAYAKYNGYYWDSIPVLKNSGVQEFKYVNGELYAYGLTLWKKSAGTWTQLADCGGQAISDLNFLNNKLVLMGGFDSVNSIPMCGFGYYDGISFSAFSTDYWPPNGRGFMCSEIFNGELYVGGTLGNQSGTIQGLMKWNGTNWVQVANGIVGGLSWVNKLTNFNNKLFIAGRFNLTQGNPGNALVAFDGLNFDTLGGGFANNNQVFDLECHNNLLFITGPCHFNLGKEFKGFCTYDGTDFCFYDSVSCTISSNPFIDLVFYNDTLIGVSSITAFNGDTIRGIGKYLGNYSSYGCLDVTGIKSNLKTNFDLNVFPNPADKLITLALGNTEGDIFTVEICNLLGEIEITNHFNKQQVEKEFEIDLSGLSSGIYFLIVRTENGFVAKRIVKSAN